MNDRSDSRATDSPEQFPVRNTDTSAIHEPVPDNSTADRNSADSGSAGGRPRSRKLPVAGALVLVVAVIAAVVWWLWPARHASLVLHGGTPAQIVTVTLDDRVGASDIGIELADRSGNPVPHAMIEVQAVEPRMGYAGEPVVAADHGTGSYRATKVGFMMTGPWQLRLSITTAGRTENLSLPLWIGG